MSDSDLIRRGDVLALFTATDPNKVPGCRYVEHAQDYCGCAERIAAIRALPAVARELEAAPRPNLDAVVGVVRRAESPSPPTCARCGGLGAVVERCLSRDCAGHFITCPDCAGGRRA